MTFKITSLSFYNSYGDDNKMTGSISLTENSSGNKIELRLNASDCDKIIDVVKDRIISTVGQAAQLFHDSVASKAAIAHRDEDDI